MDLSKISKERLIKELENRSLKPVGAGKNLVVGTLCDYPEGPMVEWFKETKKPEDLPGVNVYLRARFNGHRDYRLFYFKTDCFDNLNTRLNENPAEFSQWVTDSPMIKFERI